MSMRDRIKASSAVADQQLAEQEAVLLLQTNLDITKLSPRIQNHARYQELVKVIQSASSRNLNVAALESNIRQLGDDAWQLAKDIVAAVKQAKEG